MNSKEQKALPLASGEENNKITRHVLAWLNTFPDLPVKLVDYEMLKPDMPGMAITVPQGAAIRRSYILGGHEAEYGFGLLYRLKTGDNVDMRLKAVELLDRMGDYAAAHLPGPIDKVQPMKVEISSRATLLERYDNCDEDYLILLKLIYEVI